MARTNRSGADADSGRLRAPAKTSRRIIPKGRRRGLAGLWQRATSTLARKIIIFNLIAIHILVVGVLYLNATRENLLFQRANSLVREAELVASVLEASMQGAVDPEAPLGEAIRVGAVLDSLDIRRGVDVSIFDSQGVLSGHTVGQAALVREQPPGTTVVFDVFEAVWLWVLSFFTNEPEETAPQKSLDDVLGSMFASLSTETQLNIENLDIGSVLTAVTPVEYEGQLIGAVAMVSPVGEIDRFVREEQDRVLRLYIIALLVSVALSRTLASAIATPLAKLAEAAEIREGGARDLASGRRRIRMPDMTDRSDEIGRLSAALREMVGAMYSRIDNNEQFAADVAHEIKNPLASLRSAVVSLGNAKQAEMRQKMLSIIEHDVRRLDRLVSDISNASRLDSELVTETQETFNLIRMVKNLCEFFGQQADEKGIDFITDFREDEIRIIGLEARLAQVFVNLISNALSFCHEGDAIRVWARRREGRVLVVVEDTGPGIPDLDLNKVFNRFYSRRSDKEFGDHSGLGLSISKQIVEAHDGVIWAENIRPTSADISSDPLGTRFVVGLLV